MSSSLPHPTGKTATDRFSRASRVVRQMDLVRAKALVEIEASGAYLLEGCASVVEFAGRHGVRPWVARDLLALGRLLRAQPTLREDVRAGCISLRAAGALDRIVRTPEEPAAAWTEMARTLSTRDFCAEVKNRLEERRIGEPPVHLSLRVSRVGHAALSRVRTLLRRRFSRFVSESEAVELASFDYLDRHDPLRVKGLPRRMPDTTDAPGRSVPREVDREVRRRDREQCVVPACPHSVYLHRSHLIPHAGGGSRESENLMLLCPRHNHMMEKGLLVVRGTVYDPHFFDARGQPYTEGGRPRRRAPPRRTPRPRPPAQRDKRPPKADRGDRRPGGQAPD